MSSPRDVLRRVLDEMPDIRRRLVTRADTVTVQWLDDVRRWAEHGLGQRGTGETPVAVDEQLRAPIPLSVESTK